MPSRDFILQTGLRDRMLPQGRGSSVTLRKHGREKTSGGVDTVDVSVKDDRRSSRSAKMPGTISTSRTA